MDKLPPKLYSNLLPIDKKKLTGLLWLCNTGKIPTMYHVFYRSLHCDSTENNGENLSTEDENEELE